MAPMKKHVIHCQKVERLNDKNEDFTCLLKKIRRVKLNTTIPHIGLNK